MLLLLLAVMMLLLLVTMVVLTAVGPRLLGSHKANKKQG